MRWICIVAAILFVSSAHAQISAFKLTAEDTTNATWHNTSRFINTNKTLQPLGAFEVDIQFNGSVFTNNLVGFQFQKKVKNLAVQIAPYFFLANDLGSRFAPSADIRVGMLDKSSRRYSHKIDAIANVVWKPIKYIKLAIGKGNHQLGRGINSLLWAGNGAPSYYGLAELQTNKLSYRVQWDAIALTSVQNIKWTAKHTVTVHLPKKWQISLFEAVIWGAKDSTYNRGFDWQYLAPTVIYRPTEFNGGSADNVILGLDWSGSLYKRVSTYGQVVVDEFLLDEIRKNDGWWANKFGAQVGLSYRNKKHFLQSELNVVRPFTYSHGNTVIAYTNQSVPLGAWSGAGFAEIVAAYKYAVSNKMTIGVMGSTGAYKNLYTGNYGGNPFQSYNSRLGERNHSIGGVNSSNGITLSASVSYLAIPKLNTFLSVWVRTNVRADNDYSYTWLQIKLSNTLFSKFYKSNF